MREKGSAAGGAFLFYYGMVKNIIFDYGNVLVHWNPAPVYNDYFRNPEACAEFMAVLEQFGFHNRVDGGEKVDTVMAEFVAEYPQYEAPIQYYKTRWNEMLPDEIPGMRALLAELVSGDRFEVFGLTNWTMENFPIAYDRFEILRMIDRVVISGKEFMIKPEERIFRLLLDRYRLIPEECLFVDDRAANVEAARKTGMQAHQFESAEKLRKALALL